MEWSSSVRSSELLDLPGFRRTILMDKWSPDYPMAQLLALARVDFAFRVIEAQARTVTVGNADGHTV